MTPARRAYGSGGLSQRPDGIEGVITAHRREAWDTALHGVTCSCGITDHEPHKWTEVDYARHLVRAIRDHLAAGGAL